MELKKIDKVAIIKIDVEGFEYEVLLGCLNSFKKNRICNIICEIHIEFLKKKGITEQMIISLLKQNGFEIIPIEEK